MGGFGRIETKAHLSVVTVKILDDWVIYTLPLLYADLELNNLFFKL